MAYDLVKHADELKADMRNFFISPKQWSKSQVKIPLAWQDLRFSQENKKNVPKKRGIYAFIINHQNNHFPSHGYIMYIGITGAKSEKRTLNDRFGDYLRDKKNDKRPRINYMLNKYEDDLVFSYVPIDNQKIDLEQLEKDLNDALLPPFSINDFTANIMSRAE